jgi:hypothetical protein
MEKEGHRKQCGNNRQVNMEMFGHESKREIVQIRPRPWTCQACSGTAGDHGRADRNTAGDIILLIWVDVLLLPYAADA